MGDERRVGGTVAETYILHLQSSSQFARCLIRFFLGNPLLLRIGQHVVDTFHLRPQFYHRGGTLHQSRGGFHKLGHESLEGHEHTDAELTLQDEYRSECKHQCMGDMLEDKGVEIPFLKGHLMVAAAGKVAGPELEEPSFGSCRLDAFDIVYTRHGDAVEASLPLLHGTGKIVSQFVCVVNSIKVDAHHHHSYHSEQETVVEHNGDVEQDEYQVDRIGCKDGNERSGDIFIERLALHDIAHISLCKELHW